MDKRHELNWEEKHDLTDFWLYCDAVEEEMMKDSSFKGEDTMPLGNQMICVAFALKSYDAHVKRVNHEKHVEYMAEVFSKEHGDIPFMKHVTPKSETAAYLWYQLRQLIEGTGFEDANWFANATESDLISLKGVGKKKLEELKVRQKVVAAHLQFFKDHPDFYKEEK